MFLRIEHKDYGCGPWTVEGFDLYDPMESTLEEVAAALLLEWGRSIPVHVGGCCQHWVKDPTDYDREVAIRFVSVFPDFIIRVSLEVPGRVKYQDHRQVAVYLERE